MVVGRPDDDDARQQPEQRRQLGHILDLMGRLMVSVGVAMRGTDDLNRRDASLTSPSPRGSVARATGPAGGSASPVTVVSDKLSPSTARQAATPSTSTTEPSSAFADVVYLTENAQRTRQGKYHIRRSCHFLKGAKHPVVEMTIDKLPTPIGPCAGCCTD